MEEILEDFVLNLKSIKGEYIKSLKSEKRGMVEISQIPKPKIRRSLKNLINKYNRSAENYVIDDLNVYKHIENTMKNPLNKEIILNCIQDYYLHQNKSKIDFLKSIVFNSKESKKKFELIKINELIENAVSREDYTELVKIDMENGSKSQAKYFDKFSDILNCALEIFLLENSNEKIKIFERLNFFVELFDNFKCNKYRLKIVLKKVTKEALSEKKIPKKMLKKSLKRCYKQLGDIVYKNCAQRIGCAEGNLLSKLVEEGMETTKEMASFLEENNDIANFKTRKEAPLYHNVFVCPVLKEEIMAEDFVVKLPCCHLVSNTAYQQMAQQPRNKRCFLCNAPFDEKLSPAVRLLI